MSSMAGIVPKVATKRPLLQRFTDMIFNVGELNGNACSFPLTNLHLRSLHGTVFMQNLRGGGISKK